MTATTCYRVQPVGTDLGKHRSETSNGNLASGVHVFGSLSELCGGVRGWCDDGSQPEIVEIACDDADLRDNGDYEGYVLHKNRGEIVRRKAFENHSDLCDWASKFPGSI